MSVTSSRRPATEIGVEPSTVDSAGRRSWFGDPRHALSLERGGRPRTASGDGSLGLRVPDAVVSRLRSLRLPRPLVDQRRRAAAVGESLLDGPDLRGLARGLPQRVLDRVSFGRNVLELSRIQEIGTEAYLEEQLYPEAIDDFGLEDLLADAFPTLRMSPYQIAVRYLDDIEVPVFELLIATVLRAVYSPRQLHERLVMFWSDHFNVTLLDGLGPLLKPTDDREVARRYALGRFSDLLAASASSPAMLSYLTNDTNVKEHPNENYARELMELHTLGVDGGYTEDDVKEVARCFTGWGFRPGEAGTSFGRFRFAMSDHDTGMKEVLGEKVAAGGGIEDGRQVLDLLAGHPSTARFVSRKLLRYFWGYPPEAGNDATRTRFESTVDRVAEVFATSGGDLRQTVREIFRWYRIAEATPKLKRPFHLVASSLRAVFAGVEDPFFAVASLFAAGHLPFNWAPPNGYPDSAGYWSGFLSPRWNFSLAVGFGEAVGFRLEPSLIDASRPPEELVALLDLLILGGTMSDTTRSAVLDYLAGSPGSELRVREAIGLVLAGPEFQSY